MLFKGTIKMMTTTCSCLWWTGWHWLWPGWDQCPRSAWGSWDVLVYWPHLSPAWRSTFCKSLPSSSQILPDCSVFSILSRGRMLFIHLVTLSVFCWSVTQLVAYRRTDRKWKVGHDSAWAESATSLIKTCQQCFLTIKKKVRLKPASHICRHPVHPG